MKGNADETLKQLKDNDNRRRAVVARKEGIKKIRKLEMKSSTRDYLLLLDSKSNCKEKCTEEFN